MNLKELAESTTRVYSVVDIKAVDNEKREFTGIATTPATDRSNDIVDPMGGEYRLPISLLWQHDSMLPVGIILTAKPTKKGIEIRGSIPKVEAPSQLAARLDEAWQSLKHQLVRGLSIGFRPLEYSFMDNGGVNFTKWEWLELSLVTIPCNAEATITSIKSYDDQHRDAIVKKDAIVKTSSGVSEIKAVSIKQTKPSVEDKSMNIQEQIKNFKAARDEKQARMSVIMTEAGEKGLTLDASQTEEYDTLASEIESIDKHLIRLEVMEKTNKATAKPVEKAAAIEGYNPDRTPAVAANTEKLEPGIAFARAAKCLALGQLEHRNAIEIADNMYKGHKGIVAATTRLVTKAAVAPATTENAAWAGNLVGDETSVFADFIEYLRPQTILGRFGTGNIPSLRRVPFRTPLIGQTTGGDGYWVGEGNAKPLTKFDFSRTTLTPLKVANIAVATMEVIRDSSPSADSIIRDQLAAALRERLDIDFIDPAKSAVPDVSPASILNGVSGITSSGPTADNVREDIKAIFGAFIAANNAPTSGVWLMPATTALALSLMQNPLGQAEFPGIGMTGGTLFGLPVIVSEYIPADSGGAIVALVNASDIYLGDEGGIDISMSTEASLQMDNSPDNPTTASTVLVSLWQRNLVGFRAERTINWARRRASAVAYLTDVLWGA
jgi:HK97 family phage major capsid protein/HK97 family phage prohead protease